MPKLPKTPKGWLSRDVEWYFIEKEKRARKIAYSTHATSNLIVVLAKKNPQATIKELRRMITYDREAKKVLQAYIDAGKGDETASERFR